MLHHLHEVLILNNRNQQLHVEGLLALLSLLLHLFQRLKERLASDTLPSSDLYTAAHKPNQTTR
jgi:hypothetical protein